MHPRQSIPIEVARLANCQGGIVTREQCSSFGMTRSVIGRLLQQQSWHLLTRGVYRIEPLPTPWESHAWAGVLLGGDQAVLAGFAAGHLWGLVKQAPEVIQVLVPPAKVVSVDGPWVFTRTRQMPRSCGDLPRTRIDDTILDLCALDPDQAATWIGEALHQRRVSVKGLQRALDTRARHPHRRLVAAMLADRAEGIHSELERSYARDVEKAHALPKGSRQVTGKYQRDVDYGLLTVELDGRLGHDGMGRFRDMRRDNHHLMEGRLTLRYGWEDVTARPCEVARQVAAILVNLGWPGPLLSCPKCRTMPTVKDWAA